ncbi:MAG: hypothetical protein ACOCQR_01565 [bacterium]
MKQLNKKKSLIVIISICILLIGGVVGFLYYPDIIKVFTNDTSVQSTSSIDKNIEKNNVKTKEIERTLITQEDKEEEEKEAVIKLSYQKDYSNPFDDFLETQKNVQASDESVQTNNENAQTDDEDVKTANINAALKEAEEFLEKIQEKENVNKEDVLEVKEPQKIIEDSQKKKKSPKISEEKIEKPSKKPQEKKVEEILTEKMVKKLVPFKINGIIGNESKRFVILDTDNGSQVVESGNVIKEFEIITINKQSVIIEYKGVKTTLEIGDDISEN